MVQQTPLQIIEDAQISLYLATNDVMRGALFPTPLNRTSPEVIYTEYKSVQWAYKQNPSFAGITATSNYLYWLCAAYNLQAINIRTQGGGGSVSPITPPVVNLNPIEFIVSDTSPIPNGGNTITLDGTNGNPDFRGYNILFFRATIQQSQINPGDGSTYFFWNKVTGQFICYTNAVTSEQFLIQPTI